MLIRNNRPTVLVNRASKLTKDGIAYLDTAKSAVYDIDAWYSDGTCRTTSGDKWKVQKFSNSSEADYIVIDPVGKKK